MFNTLSSESIKNGDNSGVGGGGGLSVNSMLPINSPDDLYEAPDKSQWLKTGTVAVDTAGAYPDATVTNTGVYTGNSFSALSQDSFIRGMTSYDGHLWILGATTKKVYKYTFSGTYTGTSFDVSAETSGPIGLTWDGSNFWVVDNYGNNDRAYQYTAAGSYTGTNFSITITAAPYDITWDGSNFWLLGTNAQFTYQCYQLSPSGTYTGTFFNLTEAPSYQKLGITWDGEFFWVTSTTPKQVSKYTQSGEFTGVSFNVASTGNLSGISWSGQNLYIGNYSGNSNVYEYKPTPVVGIPTASTKYSLPVYTRIK